MAKFKVRGKKNFNGNFKVTGAKNAALKMIAAAVLIPGEVVLHNVPRILDIFRMIEVIQSLGAKVDFSGNTLKIDGTNVKSWSPDETPVKKLRGSVVIIGPLLSRFGKANFSEPGGCLIGSRPIGFHLKAFSDLGVTVKEYKKEGKYSLIDDGHYRQGNKEITLAEMSVTTTENVMMGAVLRDGKTKINIAACEPEIVDLANFLNKAGAKISGAGTHTIIVDGIRELHPAEHTVIPDRIEAGTIVIAAAICGGKVTIEDIIPEHLQLPLSKFEMANVDFEISKKEDKYADLIVKQKRKLIAPDVKWIDTRPYPGFPTDLQSPFTVLLTQAEGRCRMFETIFDSRFDYVKWLVAMGADIKILNPHMIEVRGVSSLKAKKIECSDLRGGASLVLAAMCAEGDSEIENIEYIDRGYEDFDQRLRGIGAEIERVK